MVQKQGELVSDGMAPGMLLLCVTLHNLQVLWSDESYFRTFCTRKRGVWRREYSFDAQCLSPAVQNSPGIMAWGWFGGGRRGLVFHGNGVTVDGDAYRTMLTSHFFFTLPRATLRRRNILFMQDNAKPHTACQTLDMLVAANVKLLERWPPTSPDLNPIERCWALIKNKLEGKIFTNVDALKAEVLAQWNAIPEQTLTQLVAAMPANIERVIKAKGGHARNPYH